MVREVMRSGCLCLLWKMGRQDVMLFECFCLC